MLAHGSAMGGSEDSPPVGTVSVCPPAQGKGRRLHPDPLAVAAKETGSSHDTSSTHASASADGEDELPSGHLERVVSPDCAYQMMPENAACPQQHCQVGEASDKELGEPGPVERVIAKVCVNEVAPHEPKVGGQKE